MILIDVESRRAGFSDVDGGKRVPADANWKHSTDVIEHGPDSGPAPVSALAHHHYSWCAGSRMRTSRFQRCGNSYLSVTIRNAPCSRIGLHTIAGGAAEKTRRLLRALPLASDARNPV